LEPEKFLGSGVKPASGVTDRDGSAALKAEGQDLPGVQFGFYRVRISKKDGQGRETLPARYNTQTTLGCEIAPDDPRNKRRGPGGRPREENDALIFRLTSG
jgi:hypothetical protein